MLSTGTVNSLCVLCFLICPCALCNCPFSAPHRIYCATYYNVKPRSQILRDVVYMYVSRAQQALNLPRLVNVHIAPLPKAINTSNIPRNMRICTYCNKTDVDDEFHFVLTCNFVSDLRIKYVKQYYYIKPSSFKLIQLLSTQNVKQLRNLGMFLKQAFVRRSL
jgi:hypothetical protein